MDNSKSPWSTYGRLPPQAPRADAARSEDVTLGAIDNLERGREQLQKYLANQMREYQRDPFGSDGISQDRDDALNPSSAPETIEERLTRLAREAARRSRRATRPPPA